MQIVQSNVQSAFYHFQKLTRLIIFRSNQLVTLSMDIDDFNLVIVLEMFTELRNIDIH